jgi:hypothetical protein
MAFPDDEKPVGDEVTFGPFRLSLTKRLLTRAGEPVKLNGRALDILGVAVDHFDRGANRVEHHVDRHARPSAREFVDLERLLLFLVEPASCR